MPDLPALLIIGGTVLGCLVLILMRHASRLDDDADAAQPAEHAGAVQGWSPGAELAAVPHRPLGPGEAAAIAQAYEDAVWEDQARQYRDAFEALGVHARRGIDDTFERAMRWSDRIGSGHLHTDTQEVSRQAVDDLLAAGERNAG